MYLIVSAESPSTVTIPAGANQAITRFSYEVVPGLEPETGTALRPVGCLGGGLPWRMVLTVNFQSVQPRASGTEFRIDPCHNHFVRGDSNHDGTHDISDCVSILGYLFENGTGPVLCEDAADANDDGDAHG